MSGSYPVDWERTTLGDVAFYINGYAFKPDDWKEVGLPIVRIQQINDPEADCDYYDGAIPAQYLIDDGDLLFSWSATLTTLIWDRGPAVLNQHIYKVVPKEGTALRFLHHLLDYLMDELAGQTHGTTMKHITRSDLLPFPSYIPPLPEQRRIAEILDAADDAIRQTERVIAKLRQVKAGLLHDLLTRGLDAQGRLRDPDAHPKQFKESSLGRIPREWEIKQLDSLIEPSSFVTYGVVKPGPEDSDGVLFVRGGDFPDGQILIEQLRTITKQVSAQYQRTILQGGEILVSLVGQPGACAVVPSSLAGANIARQAALIRLQSNISAYFVKAFISSEKGQKMLMSDTLGSVQQVINLRDLRQLFIPVPLRPEQNGIVETLDAADARIHAEEATLAKLRQVKRGLMDDLLTGRVRV